ncbi:MAG: T9SS C-terminal target domain-containing protein, partial [Bacteroidetes bacterium]
ESYTFENVTSNHTISTAFSVKTYSITAGAGPNGTIQPSGLIFVSHGSSLEFSITPDVNFFIEDVLVDGESVGTPESYTFTNISQSHTIQALFDANKYTLEFEIFNRDGDFIPDAVIIFNEQEFDPGVYIFTDLLPGEYFYYITRDGYFPVSGSLNLEFDTVWTIFMDEDDTADEILELTTLQVFPNPASIYFHVHAPEIILGLQVIDLSGRILQETRPGTTDVKVNTDLMEPGIYLLRLIFDRRVDYHKIQVQ